MNASPLRNAVGGIHVNPIWPKVFSPCDKHANLPVVLRKGVNTEIAYGIIETSFSNLAGQRKQERGVASNTATIIILLALRIDSGPFSSSISNYRANILGTSMRKERRARKRGGIYHIPLSITKFLALGHWSSEY